MKNLILTHYNGDISGNLDKINRYKLFLRSIQCNCPDIDIIMCTSHIPVFSDIVWEFVREFGKLNIVYIPDYFEKDGNSAISRFMTYSTIMPFIEAWYDKIIFCDCMDVCFLGNPFDLIEYPIMVFEESDSLLFKEEPINCNWAAGLTDNYLDEIRDHYIICAGVIMAKSAASFRLLVDRLVVLYHDLCHSDGFRLHGDQCLVNYLARIHRHIKVMPLENPVCRHLLRVKTPVTEEYCNKASLIHFTMCNNNATPIKEWLCNRYGIDPNTIEEAFYL